MAPSPSPATTASPSPASPRRSSRRGNVGPGSGRHDTLSGGAGDDTLPRGPGNDTLPGGPRDTPTAQHAAPGRSGRVKRSSNLQQQLLQDRLPEIIEPDRFDEDVSVAADDVPAIVYVETFGRLRRIDIVGWLHDNRQ